MTMSLAATIAQLKNYALPRAAGRPRAGAVANTGAASAALPQEDLSEVYALLARFQEHQAWTAQRLAMRP